MKNRRLLTAFLLFGMALLSTLFALQGILLSSIIDAFGLTSSDQGLPNSAAFAGGIAALLIAFALSHRIPKWTALLLSLALCGAAVFCLKLASGLAAFIAVWGVLGFGMGMMDTLLSACMAQLYTGKLGIRMMCFLHTAFGIASAGTPVLFEALMKGGLAWKDVYLFPAVLAGALVIAGLLLRPGRTDREADAPRTSASFKAVKQAKLWNYMAAAFFHGVFLSGLNTWINRFSEVYTGAGTAVPPMSFMFIGLMCSRIVIPFLPVKADSYVRLAGFAAGAVTLAGILAPAWLSPCILVSGFLFGALLPCMLSLACERIPSQTLTCTTALMLSLYVGQSVSSPVIGALEAAVSLKAGILVCCASMALASLFCLVGGGEKAPGTGDAIKT
ncbi:MAG: MFS transporter [Clostridia bacterium]|nr:MFS transporter [Clostridia bacterium]